MLFGHPPLVVRENRERRCARCGDPSNINPYDEVLFSHHTNCEVCRSVYTRLNRAERFFSLVNHTLYRDLPFASRLIARKYGKET